MVHACFSGHLYSYMSVKDLPLSKTLFDRHARQCNAIKMHMSNNIPKLKDL